MILSKPYLVRLIVFTLKTSHCCASVLQWQKVSLMHCKSRSAKMGIGSFWRIAAMPGFTALYATPKYLSSPIVRSVRYPGTVRIAEHGWSRKRSILYDGGKQTMKDETIAELIVVAILFILGLIFANLVGQSDLPFWTKFWLLS